MKICVLALMGILASGMPAAADLEAARAAYEAEDYPKALAEYQSLAAEGNVGAQYNLAVFYQHGLGTPQDLELSIKWFKEAAAQSYGDAAWAVGVMYATGAGVEADIVEAYIWFRQGAAQGSVKARKALLRAARAMTDEQVQEARQRADARRKTPQEEPDSPQPTAE